MLEQLTRSKTALVWALLVTAALASWQIGTHGVSAKLATSLVMVIAFVKVRFIGMWFMELKDGPVVLRRLFDGYVAIVGLSVIVLYLAL
jgi:Prokaryotic Cytochrome C oxidase subunit IV